MLLLSLRRVSPLSWSLGRVRASIRYEQDTCTAYAPAAHLHNGSPHLLASLSEKVHMYTYAQYWKSS